MCGSGCSKSVTAVVVLLGAYACGEDEVVVEGVGILVAITDDCNGSVSDSGRGEDGESDAAVEVRAGRLGE